MGFGVLFALICLHLYKKQKVVTFLSGILLGFAVALGWTGISISFLSVVIYGYNLPWVKGVISYFSYSTVPLGSFAIVATSWNVAGSQKNKRKALAIVALYSALYYVILYSTFNQVVAYTPTPRGELYDDWILSETLFFYILWGEVLIGAVVTAVGFWKFYEQSTGSLRRRSLWLLLSTGIVGSAILLDTVIIGSLIALDSALFLVRFSMVLGLFLIYLGFQPSS